MKTDLRDLTLEELTSRVLAMGERSHRAEQIFRWLYVKNVTDFKAMTDLPKTFVARLERSFDVGGLLCEERLISRDGTEKFLWKLRDGEHVESVLIRTKSEKTRSTICLSTQVGCKFKCPFCASGAKGFLRDLEVSEILGQISGVQSAANCRINNVVFMGMGEPLDNYDNVTKAIRIMNDPKGSGIGARKITISTCGIIPGIERLKTLGLQIELSVSLHSAEDGLRSELVPANRKYPLKDLERALIDYFNETGRVITLEYTVIGGLNDSDRDAEKLAAFAKRLKAKVNVIACNPYSWKGPREMRPGRAEAFQKMLVRKGVTATLRRSKGDDIMAACGQLAAQKRKEEGQGSGVKGQEKK